jgi:hypothetical protein
MNKVIHNIKNKATKLQSNKIALALLALGCVVSSLVGAAGPAITIEDKQPDQITSFISDNPLIAKLHILPFISIAELDAQEGFNWCKEQNPALLRVSYETDFSLPTSPMGDQLYNKITGDLDIKKNTLSTKDFENYITHFLVAYADILCKNISERKLIRSIILALIPCKIKYNIKTVVPISSRTPECEEACTSMKDIIENSVNRVMALGESSIEGEMDKFRQFLAENKNVLFLGYSDKLVSSEIEWYNILGKMVADQYRYHRSAHNDYSAPISELYEQMMDVSLVYECLLLNRTHLQRASA